MDGPRRCRAPAGMGAAGRTNASIPSAEAASSMPWLSTPRSVAGARLATTTTCVPTSVAGS